MQQKKYIPTFTPSGLSSRLVDTIGNLQLQYDANSSENTVSGGGEVNTLKDLKNGFDLSQTGTERPSIVTQSGLKLLDFDGVDDKLEMGANNLLTGLSEANMFFVLEQNTASSAIICRVGAFTSDSRLSLNITSSGLIQVQGRRVAADPLVSADSTSSITLNQRHILHVAWNASTANLEVFLDNASILNTSFSTSGTFGDGTENNTALFLGAGSSFAELDGTIGEVLVYEDVDKTQTYNYLKNKWL
jgi:hypothetical protein